MNSFLHLNRKCQSTSRDVYHFFFFLLLGRFGLKMEQYSIYTESTRGSTCKSLYMLEGCWPDIPKQREKAVSEKERQRRKWRETDFGISKITNKLCGEGI